MTITEFLEARIAEDEQREALKFRIKTDRIDAYTIGHDYVDLREKDGARERRITIPEFQDEYGEPVPDKRVLAECAAKRGVVELHGPIKDDGWISGKDHEYLWCGSCGSIDDSPEPYPCWTLRTIAAIYASHPDYQQEWAL